MKTNPVQILICLVIIALIGNSCSRVETIRPELRVTTIWGIDSTTQKNDSVGTADRCKNILIDASHDGGVWWFPQTEPFDPKAPHQGQGLAEYLKSLGYHVDEVPRGKLIQDEVLNNYGSIIVMSVYGTYTAAELESYKKVLDKGIRLVLLNDHHADDALGKMMGLEFGGAISAGAVIDSFAVHPLTKDIQSLPYIAGSLINNASTDSTIQVIGWLSQADGRKPVMAMVKHPPSLIFAMGDGNCIEGLPQPLLTNLVAWLSDNCLNE